MADAARIVVGGESHSAAYDGIRSAAADVRSLLFKSADTLAAMAEGGRLKPSILDELRAHGIAPGRDDGAHLVLTLSGSDLVRETLQAHWRDHDFVLPQAPELTDWSLRCVPVRLVD